MHLCRYKHHEHKDKELGLTRLHKSPLQKYCITRFKSSPSKLLSSISTCWTRLYRNLFLETCELNVESPLMKYLNNSHVLASWSSGVAFFILSVIELVEIGWNIIGLIYKHRYILGLIAAPRNVFAISSAVLLGLQTCFYVSNSSQGWWKRDVDFEEL